MVTSKLAAHHCSTPIMYSCLQLGFSVPLCLYAHNLDSPSGMNKVVGMELPPRYPKSAVISIMNQRHSGIRRDHDAEETLKVMMQPNKAADYPGSNNPFALLGNPRTVRITSGINGINIGATALTTPTGTSEIISTSGGALDPIQGITNGIHDSIIEDGAVSRSSSDDVTSSLVDGKFKKTENSLSFDENLNLDNGAAATSDHSIKLELENLYRQKWIRKFDPNMDAKNLRRVIGNRLAAQKSRVKKLEYIAQLEQLVNSLKAAVSSVAYQISHYDCKRIELSVENNLLRKRMARLNGEQNLKQAKNEWLKQEKHRLWGIFMQQHQQQKLQQTEHPQLQHQLQQQLQPPGQIHQQPQEMTEYELGQEQLVDINNTKPNESSSCLY